MALQPTGESRRHEINRTASGVTVRFSMVNASQPEASGAQNPGNGFTPYATMNALQTDSNSGYQAKLAAFFTALGNPANQSTLVSQAQFSDSSCISAPDAGFPTSWTTASVNITGNSIMHDVQTANLQVMLGQSATAGGKTLTQVVNNGIYGMRWEEMLYGGGPETPVGKGNYKDFFVVQPYNASNANVKIMVTGEWVNSQFETPAANVAWAKQYTQYARSIGWIVFLLTPLDNLRQDWRTYKAQLMPLIMAEPSLANYIIDISNVPYIGQDGAANDPARFPDGTHIVTGGPGGTPTRAQVCLTDVIRKRIADVAGLPIPTDISNIQVSQTGSTVTVSVQTSSFIEYGMSASGSTPTVWQDSPVFTNVSGTPTFFARMYVKPSAILSKSLATGTPGNITPPANTFTAFNDVNKTIQLVPAPGVPVTDYLWFPTAAGSAQAQVVPASGIISVGDIQGSITTFALAATGRNQSPEAASQAFTKTPTGPSYEPETIAYKNVVEQGVGTVQDLDFVDRFFKNAKQHNYLSVLGHCVAARFGTKGGEVGGNLTTAFSLVNQELNSPDTPRNGGIVTYANGRPYFNFRGQTGTDPKDQLFNNFPPAAEGFVTGVKSYTLLSIGHGAAHQTVYGGPFASIGAYSASMGISPGGSKFFVNRSAGSNSYAEFGVNSSQNVMLTSRFNVNNLSLEAWQEKTKLISQTVGSPTPIPDDKAFVALGAIAEFEGILGGVEVEMFLTAAVTDAQISAIQDFWRNELPVF